VTKAELRDHIARNHLSILGPGGALNASDAELIETVMDNCQSELEQMETALWDIEDLPAYAIESFGLYVRASVNAFGFQPDYTAKAFALGALRALTADTRASVGTAEFF